MVNKRGNSRACGSTGLQNIHTDKQMWSLSEASIYKHTTKWQIAGRMDGWRADWGMWKWWISEWTCEDRLTRRVKDKWRSATGCSGGLTIWLGYPANVSTHRCARKKTKTPTIPLVCMQALLNIKVYFFFPSSKDKNCCLCVQQNLSPTLQLDLTWFRTDYDLVYVLLESLTGKQGWSQWKQRGQIFLWKKKTWQYSGVHWTFLSTPPTWSNDYYKKSTLLIQQKTERGWGQILS